MFFRKGLSDNFSFYLIDTAPLTFKLTNLKSPNCTQEETYIGNIINITAMSQHKIDKTNFTCISMFASGLKNANLDVAGH